MLLQSTILCSPYRGQAARLGRVVAARIVVVLRLVLARWQVIVVRQVAMANEWPQAGLFSLLGGGSVDRGGRAAARDRVADRVGEQGAARASVSSWPGGGSVNRGGQTASPGRAAGCA